MNILKKSDIINPTEYQRFVKNFDMDNIYNKITSGINKYRFFNIEIEKNKIKITAKLDTKRLIFLNEYKKHLPSQHFSFIEEQNLSKTFHLSHKKKIITFLHLDWVVALCYLKIVKENTDLIEHLKCETNNPNISNYITKSKRAYEENRSSIYTVNKDSVVVHLRNESKSKNTTKLTNENYNLIKENKLISFIEIGSGFDNSKLNTFIIDLNRSCEKILQIKSVNEGQKFGIKIRKIKRTKKNGMFIKQQNVIILDPRHVDSLNHELGHWYHTHFINEIDNVIEAEIFAENFADKIINH